MRTSLPDPEPPISTIPPGAPRRPSPEGHERHRGRVPTGPAHAHRSLIRAHPSPPSRPPPHAGQRPGAMSATAAHPHWSRWAPASPDPWAPISTFPPGAPRGQRPKAKSATAAASRQVRPTHTSLPDPVAPISTVLPGVRAGQRPTLPQGGRFRAPPQGRALLSSQGGRVRQGNALERRPAFHPGRTAPPRPRPRRAGAFPLGTTAAREGATSPPATRAKGRSTPAIHDMLTRKIN